MTAIDHHSKIGGPNRANSTTTTVKSAFAAAVVASVLSAEGSASRTHCNTSIASSK